jgi:hypothetical protein
VTVADTIAPFALSLTLVFPFYLVLRARLLAFVAGATIVAALALVLETGAQDLIGPENGPIVLILVVAPVVEELLKLALSSATGRDYRSAVGVGAGFAAAENGVYFLAAWGEPTVNLIVLVVLRAVTDPLLHITATTYTTLSLHGSEWGLPAGLAIHMLWNVIAFSEGYLPSALGLALIGASALALLLLLRYAYRDPALRAELRPLAGPIRWRTSGA